jgi:hypothetical protein
MRKLVGPPPQAIETDSLRVSRIAFAKWRSKAGKFLGPAIQSFPSPGVLRLRRPAV